MPDHSSSEQTSSPVDFGAPVNASILTFLGSPKRLARSVSIVRDQPSCSPEAVKNALEKLGVHPDLIIRLWNEITVKLPVDCRWLVYGKPVLVRPSSGVIFAFCGGTHTYALRLPPQTFQEALAAGASRLWKYPALPSLNIAASEFNLDVIGPEWVFGRWFDEEIDWCLAAYQFAAESGQ
jgi:hypothetical protein